MIWFWLAATILALVLSGVSLLSAHRKSQRIGELTTELENANATIKAVRDELRKARNPVPTLAALNRMFNSD